MKKIAYLFSLIFLVLVNFSFAQDSPITITNMKAEPALVIPGGNVLLSCYVTHRQDPMSIRQVGATFRHGENNTDYPMLFDDGTHGDIEAEDGIYSLVIKAPNNSGSAEIVFHAVDNDGNEIDSDLLPLTIQ